MCKVRSLPLGFVLPLLLAGAFGLPGALAEGRHGDLSETNDFCAAADLAANLQVLTDTDGGIYGLKVALHNLSKTNALILRLYDVPEKTIVVNLYGSVSGPSKRLSKPEPALKLYEWHFVNLRLERDATAEWFIRLKDRLSDRDLLPECLRGTLGVTVTVWYRKADESKAGGSEDAFFSFLYPRALITRKALEGDPTEKYEKTLGSSGVPLR